MNPIRKLRRFASVLRARVTAVYVSLLWRWQRGRAVPHGLQRPLIVTLTSYPPRYPTLALTLKSLLAQSARPDHVYLWIAADDLAALPDNVRRLEDEGLEIRSTEDFRSFTKIIPALMSGVDGFLVTADDDQYYRRHWLRELVAGYRPGRKEVVCARAHRILLDSTGMPVPYFQWQSEVAAGSDERLLFPTGVGGVLYEPGIFHPDVTRAEVFRQLCPTADDVWLYWMAALNGARFRKVGPRRRQIIWPDSQRVSLLSTNLTANDEQIANMIARYGMPSGSSS